MNTLKDLKNRIVPGATLTLVGCNFPHKWMNKARIVADKNTVGFTLWSGERVSHMDWPKASCLSFPTVNSFKWQEGGSFLTYTIEDQK